MRGKTVPLRPSLTALVVFGVGCLLWAMLTDMLHRRDAAIETLCANIEGLADQMLDTNEEKWRNEVLKLHKDCRVMVPDDDG